ncbi:MAG: TolC family protein, partial [Muribaculum sp.]|nr:TolC family protein [Muribaculum sp.]
MRKIKILFCLISTIVLHASADNTVRLTLADAIRLANDSSLTAFRNKNMFLSGYWEFHAYKANRLPGLSLDVVPATYNRYITTRYDYNQNIDVYRPQQIYSASAGLNLTQNIDFLGGTVYL